MDIQELNKYFDLVRKRSETQEILYNIQIMAEHMEQLVSDDDCSNGANSETANTTIAELEDQIECYDAEMIKRKPRIETFITGIDDIFIRTIFRLRFVQGLRWKEVAALMGGSNTDESMKATCYRYLRKLKMAEEKKA